MTKYDVENVIGGMNDMEDIKSALQLIGIGYKERKYGNHSGVIVSCDGEQFRVRAGGTLVKLKSADSVGAL